MCRPRPGWPTASRVLARAARDRDLPGRVRERDLTAPPSSIRRRMKALVTGGAGFIGSNLVDALSRAATR